MVSQLSLGGTGLSLTGSTADLLLNDNYISGGTVNTGIYLGDTGFVGVRISGEPFMDGSFQPEAAFHIEKSRLIAASTTLTDLSDYTFILDCGTQASDCAALSRSTGFAVKQNTDDTNLNDMMILAEDFLFDRPNGDGAYVVFDGSTERVGIGTSTPSQKLEVDGNIMLSGNNAIAFGGSTDNQISWSGANLQLDSTGAFQISDPTQILSGNSFRVLDTGNTDHVTFSHDGTDFNIVGTNTTDINFSGANVRIAGGLKDSSDSLGTNGYVLQTTGAGTQWVATSSLGIGGGSSVTFGTDNQIPFVNAGGTDFDYSSELTFNGTNLGLASGDGISFGGVRYFTADTVSDSILIGENAGAAFSINARVIAIGDDAGQNASTTNSPRFNVFWA